jgi:hypothetical protein
LTQDVIESQNRTITNEEIESVINNLPKNKSRINGFTGEFYQTFSE